MQISPDDPIGAAIKRMIGQGCPHFSIDRRGVPRPIQYMTGMLDRHPGLWNRIADMRTMRGTALLAPSNRGKQFPNWPDWCYFPRGMAAVALVPDRKDDVDHVKVAHELESEAVAALAAWRMTQGIYRFDSTLFCELFKTSIEGEIPVDVFRRLPEWCIYIEVPEDVVALHESLRSVCGVFVYRDCDDEEGDGNLHFILDIEGGFLKALMPLPLAGGTIMESLQARLEANRKTRIQQILAETGSTAVTKHEVEDWFGEVGRDVVQRTATELAPYISLVLYICSANSDLRDRSGRRGRPANPEPIKTANGTKTYPAGAITFWEVGCRVGPALRRALEAHDEPAAQPSAGERPHHASPRPHIRAAHWHAFWTGPKASENRLLVVKWLPPIPVNVEGPEDLVPTIRSVD